MHQISLLVPRESTVPLFAHPLERSAVSVPPKTPLYVAVVIDTEEEFDWSKPFERTSNSIEHMREIGVVQRIFEAYKLIPTYVIDYSIASQPEGWKPLKDYHDSGLADIGAHLQAWVSPPFIEMVTTYNSYAGNIDPALEREKLRILRDEIAHNFNAAPKVYRAGRYGLGVRSFESIAALGFEVDSSPSPGYDLSADGGPDYLGYQPAPFWVGSTPGGLLCVPVTGGVVGWLPEYWREQGHRCLYRHGAVGQRALGLLSRFGAISRIRLSPEGHSLDELKRLSWDMIRRGVPLLALSFHSPTIMVGGTPYSHSSTARDAFLKRLQDYLDYAFGTLGATPITLPGFRKSLLSP
jgi:hypothetical protein